MDGEVEDIGVKGASKVGERGMGGGGKQQS